MPRHAPPATRLTEGDLRVRSIPEIDRIRTQRGGIWRVLRSIHRRRPFLTAIIVLAAPAFSLLAKTPAYDLLGTDRSWRFFVPWGLVIFGTVVRLWGAGNLRKNQEITETGIYQLVRHPLYLGSLCFFLAYFLTVADPRIGIVLFGLLVVFIYYPTMLAEEEFLALKFPELGSRAARPPRLLPDVRRLPEAVRNERFRIRSAFTNLGFRSLWFLIALPIFLRILRWIQLALV